MIVRLALAVVVLGANLVHAQQAVVRVSQAPHYVDVPIDIEVVAQGFEQSPEPEVEVDPPNGATLDLLGVSPNVSTSVTVINGRMTRTETVRHVYRYRLLPSSEGTVTVGPFRLSQGGATARTRALELRIDTVPTSGDQRFRLVLPESRIWVGQRVPVVVEWWLTERLADRLAGRRARVPLFDQVDSFKFEDVSNPGARNSLVVETRSGPVELPASVKRDTWNGQPYFVVSVRRTMIALKSGSFEIEPASIVVEEAIRWQRDFFGDRTPAQVRRLRVADEPRTLSIESPPLAGRPPSFAGAVGKGFNVEARADRWCRRATLSSSPWKCAGTVRSIRSHCRHWRKAAWTRVCSVCPMARWRAPSTMA